MYKIKFKGEDFLLVGSPEDGGAIVKEEQFENLEPSFAHLYESGRVLRYGEVIGNRDDIEVGEKLADTPSFSQAISAMLAELDNSWGPKDADS